MAAKKFIDLLLSYESQKKAMLLGLRPIRKDITLTSPFIKENGVIAGINDKNKFHVPDENVKAGAIEFMKRMKPRDNIKIVVFNHKIEVLTELCLIRNCRELIIKKINGIFPEGQTALYDAASKTYEELKVLKKKPNRRYSLIILSDGKDTNSSINRHDFLDTLPTGEEYEII